MSSSGPLCDRGKIGITLTKQLRVLFLIALQTLAWVGCAFADTRPPQSKSARVQITLFWEPGCPFCGRAKQFFEARPETRGWLKVRLIDVSASPDARENFLRATRLFGIKRPGVPLVVVGNRHFLGFDSADGIGRKILEAADACRKRSCPTLDQLLSGAPGSVGRVENKSATRPPSITLPLIGPVNTSTLSLPALTIVLAAIDGFNPCAMWVLVFLVGLLVGVQDRVRMWILGGAFLLTSGVVYFGFLAAWLNVFLFLGALIWVRLIVGIVAIGSGAYYLHAFAVDAAAECRVTNPSQRQRIMTALRTSVSEKRFLAAIAGIVVLAAAVNLIELLCSAGIPAVFTDLLTLSNLPLWQYYAYLLLYVGVFMLDDLIIFATAMVTLQATSMTNQYLRYSHLIGGIGMLTIGALLLFAPEWLTFQT